MSRLNLLCLLVLLLAFVGGWNAANAADTYQPNDEVEVFFLNKWWPGRVVEVGRRGEVMVEYEFAGKTQTQPFQPKLVRGLFEANAMSPGRFWSDESGKFRIRAALLKLEKDSITLRRTDMTELSVPIARLSQADKDFLKKFQKEAAVIAATRGPEPPPLVEFSTSNAQQAWSLWGGKNSDSAGLPLDPLPSYLKLKQAGVAFPTQDVFDRLGTVLPLGGNDGWVIAAVENETPGSPKATRLLWVSLVKQKIERQHALPAAEVVVDYHPPSKQLLTYNTSIAGEDSGRGTPTLSLWKVSPVEVEITPIVRWKASPGKDFDENNPWARIVDANTVLQRWTREEFVAWDISEKSVRYRLGQESFFKPNATLSHGRKYLLLPEDKGVRLIEAATGRLLATFSTTDGCAGAAFTEDGQRLAAIGRNQLHIWDMTNPTAPPEILQADAIGTPFTSTLDWVGPDRIMADQLGGRNKVLFSLKHRVALWNYEFDFNAVPDKPGRRFRHVIAGHLVYAASVRDGSKTGLAVGAVALPGPQVDDADKSLDPESLMVIKRGTAMRVDIQAGAFNQQVWESVQRLMTKNGWTYDANSTILLTAEMRQTQPQQVRYRMFGVSAAGEQTATVAPYIAALRIWLPDKTPAWEGVTSSGAPHMVRLAQNQSVQAEIDRWQKPDPEFFNRVDVPERILDPKKRNGVGTTQVTNRGLVVQQQ